MIKHVCVVCQPTPTFPSLQHRMKLLLQYLCGDSESTLSACPLFFIYMQGVSLGTPLSCWATAAYSMPSSEKCSSWWSSTCGRFSGSQKGEQKLWNIHCIELRNCKVLWADRGVTRPRVSCQAAFLFFSPAFKICIFWKLVFSSCFSFFPCGYVWVVPGTTNERLLLCSPCSACDTPWISSQSYVIPKGKPCTIGIFRVRNKNQLWDQGFRPSLSLQAVCDTSSNIYQHEYSVRGTMFAVRPRNMRSMSSNVIHSWTFP